MEYKTVNLKKPVHAAIKKVMANKEIEGSIAYFVEKAIMKEVEVLVKSAEEEFGISNFVVIMTFVISFGVVKGLLNLYGGHLSEKYGRSGLTRSGSRKPRGSTWPIRFRAHRSLTT